MRHENKFKIGDRVRFVEPYAGLEAGAEGTVTGFWAAGVDVNVNGIDHGCFYSRVELIPSLTIEPGKHYRTRSGKPTGRVTDGDTGFEAVVDGRVRIFDKAGGAVHGDDDIVEAWVPKVGERVVEVDGNPHDFLGHWRNYWQDVEGPLVDGVFIVTGVGAEWISYSNREGGRGPNASVEYLQPAPVASQLALLIEAGKFYRTRDGRKVGPVILYRNDELSRGFYKAGSKHYSESGECCYMGISGEWPYPDEDLIAEWQETTNVGAQVDTLAEEYGPAPASNDNAAKPKFKVGDRVVVTCNKTNGGTPIREYVIGGVYPITSIIKDLNGNDAVQLNSHYQYLKQGQFQLTTTAIVALIENGQPKPAAIPHVHANQAAAEREAKRLAGIHKGKRFGVYVLASTAEEAAPTYRHEWQRLAVAGRKIDAIRELRGLTGMQLKPAKDVVEHFTAYPYGQAA